MLAHGSVGPIAGAPVVFIEARLLGAIQRRSWLVGGSVLDCLSRHLDRDLRVEPAHVVGPLRRDEHLMAEPPVARVDDQVSNGPGLVVDQHALDVAEIAIAGMYVVFHDRPATAKVGVFTLASGGLSPRVGALLFRAYAVR